MFLVLREGSENSNFSSNFKLPKFKKVQFILGDEGGGVKKIVDFFHLVGHFSFECFPKGRFQKNNGIFRTHPASTLNGKKRWSKNALNHLK